MMATRTFVAGWSSRLPFVIYVNEQRPGQAFRVMRG
jgi:hypothetical protein